LPPLITADDVNNEPERAHAVFHDGRYFVFWSTQRSTFAPELRGAPNGLYGMVADSLFGEYRPLNGTSPVIANPKGEPFQPYSWFVDVCLQVCSFVDSGALRTVCRKTGISAVCPRLCCNWRSMAMPADWRKALCAAHASAGRL